MAGEAELRAVADVVGHFDWGKENVCTELIVVIYSACYPPLSLVSTGTTLIVVGG